MDSGTTFFGKCSDNEGCGGDNSDLSITSWSTDSSEHGGGEVVERYGIKGECEVSSSITHNVDTTSSSMRKADLYNDSADDDCIIVDIKTNKKPGNNLTICDGCDAGGESDELLILQETGELACRDYPHPRYLCAKFPFDATPHHRHCTLCHCYVCDTPAPCIYWNVGDQMAYHCHATHKEKFWRAERIIIRENKKNPVDLKHVATASGNTQPGSSHPSFCHRSTPAFRWGRPSSLLPESTANNPCNEGLPFAWGQQVMQRPPAPGGPRPPPVAGSSLTAQGLQSSTRFKRSAPKRS